MINKDQLFSLVKNTSRHISLSEKYSYNTVDYINEEKNVIWLGYNIVNQQIPINDDRS